jgi:hypothetical protein
MSAAFKVNHVPLEATTNIGAHIIAELIEQALPIETGVGEITAYARDADGQTDQLFLRYQGNQKEFQYTNYQLYSVTDTDFFTFLPGRILIYFGLFTPKTGKNFDENYTIKLVPGIATKIISAVLCQEGSTPNSAIIYANVKDKEGDYFKNIQFGYSNSLTTKAYYLIMANV